MQSLTSFSAVEKEHYKGGKEKPMKFDSRPLGKDNPPYRKKTGEVRSSSYKKNPGQANRKTVMKMLSKGRVKAGHSGRKFDVEPLIPGHAGY